MERISITPRGDWQQQVESVGVTHHTLAKGEMLWNESACYHLVAREIAELATATTEIENMSLALIERVIEQRRYAELNIPKCAWPLIEASWERGDKNLYGRLDFSYDGTQPPKLLEYNADIPRALPEASVGQLQWLNQVRPGSMQFNNIHECLVEAWLQFGPEPIHLACMQGSLEYYTNIVYLADTIKQAGLTPKLDYIEKIHWNGRYFADSENMEIKTLFKLYPWDCLIKGEYSVYGHQSSLRIIEPIWKMILQNKGFMVLLWELFPDHPNLLPSYYDNKHFSGNYVKKPCLGREGQNVSLYCGQSVIATDGAYSEGPFMYQQAHLLPNFGGMHPVIGSWLIASKPAGIGIRESASLITKNTSGFVPHFYD